MKAFSGHFCLALLPCHLFYKCHFKVLLMLKIILPFLFELGAIHERVIERREKMTNIIQGLVEIIFKN